MKLYKYNPEKLQYQEFNTNYGITFLKIAVIFLSSILFLGLTSTPRDPEVITEVEKILIIDEGFNQLDSESELKLLKKINNHENLTVIMVYHKISNQIKLDNIYNIENYELNLKND